jgi:hypothetical protein
MKILAVLTLLIALSSAAYNDFDYDYVANATQAYSVYYDDSTGTCDGTLTYTASTNKIVGSGTCTGLKGNLTAAHIHDAGDGYSVTYNNGSPLPECTITVDADAATYSVDCTLPTDSTDAIDALCADRCYFNFHTTYEPNGEVRRNLIGLKAKCLFAGGVPDDGTLVVADDAPDTGVRVASFCVTFYATQKAGVTGSNAGGYMTICWDAAKGTLTFSGCFYGIQNYIYGIYAELEGESSYFLYISSTGFTSDVPFAFVEEGVTDWQIAKLCSTNARITVDTSDYSDGELEIYITPNDADGNPTFPVNKATCRPATPKIDDQKALTCWYGVDSSQYEYTCSAGQFCAVSESAGYDYKSCTSIDYCYTCDCGVDYEANLPTFGYACCDTDYCNVGSLNLQYCILGSGSGSISAGLLVSLFVALLMKWFN